MTNALISHAIKPHLVGASKAFPADTYLSKTRLAFHAASSRYQPNPNRSNRTQTSFSRFGRSTSLYKLQVAIFVAEE